MVRGLELLRVVRDPSGFPQWLLLHLQARGNVPWQSQAMCLPLPHLKHSCWLLLWLCSIGSGLGRGGKLRRGPSCVLGFDKACAGARDVDLAGTGALGAASGVVEEVLPLAPFFFSRRGSTLLLFASLARSLLLRRTTKAWSLAKD